MSRRLYSNEVPTDQHQIGLRRGYLRGYKEGYERGYQDGFKRGFKEVLDLKSEWEQRMAAYIHEMETLIDELQKQQGELAEKYTEAIESYKSHLEEELGDIVALAAEEYLNQSLTQDPALIKGILRRSLEKFSGKFAIEIRSNEQFINHIEDFLLSSDSVLQRFNEVRTKLDRNLGVGIVIDSEEGQVDARVGTLAKNLRALVQSVVYDHPENRVS